MVGGDPASFPAGYNSGNGKMVVNYHEHLCNRRHPRLL
jgi:hypothetical protein